ncbi:hypothetical protein FVE85_2473 [Porphyridium purpureum]|uniref:DNA polymerase V n=1 Tax=Porphyridium purpureum TaxID=35688 RepID=A0A5J4YJQ1_PORPP|nr:hypothetical protein FVE85_2473 [Porphyridium purpureum]|eukprot:POR7016..scf291_13
MEQMGRATVVAAAATSALQVPEHVRLEIEQCRNPDATRRAQAARALARATTAHEQQMQLSDGVNAVSKYVLRRLVQGLASCNEFARPGFAAALCAVLRGDENEATASRDNSSRLRAVAVEILDNAYPTTLFTLGKKAREAREAALARVFFWTAYVKSFGPVPSRAPREANGDKTLTSARGGLTSQGNSLKELALQAESGKLSSQTRPSIPAADVHMVVSQLCELSKLTHWGLHGACLRIAQFIAPQMWNEPEVLAMVTGMVAELKTSHVGLEWALFLANMTPEVQTKFSMAGSLNSSSASVLNLVYAPFSKGKQGKKLHAALLSAFETGFPPQLDETKALDVRIPRVFSQLIVLLRAHMCKSDHEELADVSISKSDKGSAETVSAVVGLFIVLWTQLIYPKMLAPFNNADKINTALAWLGTGLPWLQGKLELVLSDEVCETLGKISVTGKKVLMSHLTESARDCRVKFFDSWSDVEALVSRYFKYPHLIELVDATAFTRGIQNLKELVDNYDTKLDALTQRTMKLMLESDLGGDENKSKHRAVSKLLHLLSSCTKGSKTEGSTNSNRKTIQAHLKQLIALASKDGAKGQTVTTMLDALLEMSHKARMDVLDLVCEGFKQHGDIMVLALNMISYFREASGDSSVPVSANLESCLCSALSLCALAVSKDGADDVSVVQAEIQNVLSHFDSHVDNGAQEEPRPQMHVDEVFFIETLAELLGLDNANVRRIVNRIFREAVTSGLIAQPGLDQLVKALVGREADESNSDESDEERDSDSDSDSDDDVAAEDNEAERGGESGDESGSDSGKSSTSSEQSDKSTESEEAGSVKDDTSDDDEGLDIDAVDEAELEAFDARVSELLKGMNVKPSSSAARKAREQKMMHRSTRILQLFEVFVRELLQADKTMRALSPQTSNVELQLICIQLLVTVLQSKELAENEIVMEKAAHLLSIGLVKKLSSRRLAESVNPGRLGKSDAMELLGVVIEDAMSAMGARKASSSENVHQALGAAAAFLVNVTVQLECGEEIMDVVARSVSDVVRAYSTSRQSLNVSPSWFLDVLRRGVVAVEGQVHGLPIVGWRLLPALADASRNPRTPFLAHATIDAIHELCRIEQRARSQRQTPPDWALVWETCRALFADMVDSTSSSDQQGEAEGHAKRKRSGTASAHRINGVLAVVKAAMAAGGDQDQRGVASVRVALENLLPLVSNSAVQRRVADIITELTDHEDTTQSPIALDETKAKKKRRKQ